MGFTQFFLSPGFWTVNIGDFMIKDGDDDEDADDDDDVDNNKDDKKWWL